MREESDRAAVEARDDSRREQPRRWPLGGQCLGPSCVAHSLDGASVERSVFRFNPVYVRERFSCVPDRQTTAWYRRKKSRRRMELGKSGPTPCAWHIALTLRSLFASH